MKHTIAITVDTQDLSRFTDSYIATLWHVSQANPTGMGDKDAGELAELVGREIVRRFLQNTAPELWAHQGRDHYWNALIKFARWNGTEWVAKAQEATGIEKGAIVIYGPQGCGKTKHAKAIAAHYGKSKVLHEWSPGMPVPSDTIAFTSVEGIEAAIDYREALQALHHHSTDSPATDTGAA